MALVIIQNSICKTLRNYLPKRRKYFSSTGFCNVATQSTDSLDRSQSANRTDCDQLQKYVQAHWDDRVTRDDETVQWMKDRLIAGDRSVLAESITLVESRHPTERARAQQLLAELLSTAKSKLSEGEETVSLRVGITGSPGVGKSSLIEAFGQHVIEQHKQKLAVLTVDPSSQTTGGSIMGDITRMTNLSRNPNAYLRSSATRGTLGGVTRGTHEAVILCEGAGYNLVFIETVGVGQSEGVVADIVDMVVVLVSPTHGDELQGIKRGLMELADLVVITKSDGELVNQARITQAEFVSATKMMKPRWGKLWKPPVVRVSARTMEGIPEIWNSVQNYKQTMTSAGMLLKQRHTQQVRWMWQNVENEIVELFRYHPEVVARTPQMVEDLREGRTTPGLAAEHLLRGFLRV